jgi:hypothetical protein
MRLLALGLALMLIGCASTTLESQNIASYQIGAERTANIGEPLLVDQKGTIETVKEWVGIINSPNGWALKTNYSPDYLRRELVYSGKSGQTIEIAYREFRGGLAAQPFHQSLKYDLSSSNEIRFQNFDLEIIQADNQTIRYRVLSDHH